ncbi:MAG TPA: hypothetical protein VNN79_03325 [Actinomycetota bacterium]|nr:hypothetical protein [Actinomycetota bacterium]
MPYKDLDRQRLYNREWHTRVARVGGGVKEVLFHDQMHRLYRLVRGRVAREISPSHPSYWPAVRAAFREQVALIRLEPPEVEAA